MSRGITAALQAEFDGTSLSLILFVEAEFNNQFVRFWSGYGDISWDSETWSGAGNLINISPIRQTGIVIASGIEVTLSGIPSSNLSLVLDDLRNGDSLKIYVGAVDSSNNIIADPDLLFSGFIDRASIIESQGISLIKVQGENRLRTLRRLRERRYTSEDQFIDYPGDLFFEYVPGLQDKKIPWGAGVTHVDVSQPTVNTSSVSVGTGSTANHRQTFGGGG